jgi:hypothetical protein
VPAQESFLVPALVALALVMEYRECQERDLVEGVQMKDRRQERDPEHLESLVLALVELALAMEYRGHQERDLVEAVPMQGRRLERDHS